MRRLRSVIPAIVMSVAVMCATSIPAQAAPYDNWYNNRLVYGIGGGGQAYWIAPSASNLTGSIDNAMANWINTSSRLGVWTPLYWSKTTNKSSARMELHYIYGPTTSFCGRANLIRNSNPVYPWLGTNRNWVWGKIDFNTRTFFTSGCTNRQGIVSHEMGHVFGLSHDLGSGSHLMYYGIAGTSVQWATVDEANRINALY